MPSLPHPDRAQLQLADVLAALGHPLRLRIVRALATGEERSCGTVLPDGASVPKSSASHHWRILREGGVVRQRRDGRYLMVSLRRDDLAARFPGLLDVVVAVDTSEASAAGDQLPPTPTGNT
ncbi:MULTISPECIES: helix-turn-helix transcriptional regulator [unclassified Nocardia]|uniref:ArsR/SmtB family transcription factor n=1 Tax=unclassified Nocardia TaxID=2637762 RepID=UPI001CE3CB65|nr:MULTISPECIES: metalloregulator ArsR/SmtB family transcription factor [unclassified Nocardia]